MVKIRVNYDGESGGNNNNNKNNNNDNNDNNNNNKNTKWGQNLCGPGKFIMCYPTKQKALIRTAIIEDVLVKSGFATLTEELQDKLISTRDDHEKKETLQLLEMATFAQEQIDHYCSDIKRGSCGKQSYLGSLWILPDLDRILGPRYALSEVNSLVKMWHSLDGPCCC